MKYESRITYHSKDMTNVKVFADRQTDKQTDGQAKSHMPPIFRYGGIKRKYLYLISQTITIIRMFSPKLVFTEWRVPH
jgi:hypothetical protein